jgi:hypothetical protein
VEMEVGGQLHAPAPLPSGKEPPPYPFQSRSGCHGEEKNPDPAANRTPAVQPVVRRYTD